MNYTKTLFKRDAVTFEFRGGDSSIYNELDPLIMINNIFPADTKTSEVDSKLPKYIQLNETQAGVQPSVGDEVRNPCFDCKKASSFSEKMICSDIFLLKLDQALNTNYNLMLSADIGDGAAQDLRQTQSDWNRQKDKCRDKNCLEIIYSERLDLICDYPVISGVHPICINSTEITD